jgi:hypothetical protein
VDVPGEFYQIFVKEHNTMYKKQGLLLRRTALLIIKKNDVLDSNHSSRSKSFRIHPVTIYPLKYVLIDFLDVWYGYSSKF